MGRVSSLLRLALNKTSQVVIGSCMVFVLVYPSGFIVRFLVGAAVNSIVVKILKRIINEQRPDEAIQQGR